jgi:large subunit ribosomal protein L6
MSRIAKRPVVIPAGVTVKVESGIISVKGPKGTATQPLHHLTGIAQEGSEIQVTALGNSKLAKALSGTTRALVHNMVLGVTTGYEKKLTLVGVGYRAKLQGSTLNLTLGFSHPLDHEIPAGITIECPSQTEILVKGIDKQLVGQVASDIRAYRPPEPYKGKGVRYANEVIILKEAKKK